MEWAFQEPASCLGQCSLLLSLSFAKVVAKAFKHIFTSPSSVKKEVKAMRSGNARIHGMTHVTTSSIAYVATQVRLLLTWVSYYLTTHDSFASLYHLHLCSAGRIP